MTVWPNLRMRRLEPEWMDDPQLDPAMHRNALRGLARLNRLSSPVARMWPVIREAVRQRGGRMRLLDVACGGGDVTLALWRRARREGLPIEVHGCDLSATALGHAQEAAEREDADLVYHRCNVLADPLPDECDIITCALFLHHLTDEQIKDLLTKMRQRAALVVVSDLRRTPLGLLAAQVATRIVTRSPVVHVDGPRSVRAALTMDELKALANKAGMRNAQVHPTFPERMLLTWHCS